MLDVIHVCLSPWVSAALGSRLAMSARVLCHMDASDTIIYVSQKGANGPGPGKVAPVGVPCVRPQSDMMCYMLDRCGLGSGSRQIWYQSLTACWISKPACSKLSLEML